MLRQSVYLPKYQVQANTNRGLIPAHDEEQNNRHGRFLLNTNCATLVIALSVLGLAIWILVCVYALKHDHDGLERTCAAGPEVMPTMPCLINGQCAGTCPTGDTEDCPTLQFKDNGEVDLDCTSEDRNCIWHYHLQTETAWLANSPLFAGPFGDLLRLWFEDVPRFRNLCAQGLDLTDPTTRTFFESGCLTISYNAGFVPAGKKREDLDRIYNVGCEVSFACMSHNPATPFFVDSIAPDKRRKRKK